MNFAEPSSDKPASLGSTSRAMPRSHLVLAGAFVFVLAVFSLLPLLDLIEISNVGEGREGVVVQEILDSGNFILPLRNGQFVPSKPILFHWVSAIFSLVNGSVDLISLRLPSALAGIGTILLVWALATSYAGILAGIVAALMLLSIQGFAAVSIEGRVDSVFSFLVVLSISIWLFGLRRNGDKPLREMPGLVYHLTGIACGLAFLTKGPVGLVFVGLVVGAVTVAEFGIRQLRDLVRLGWVWAVAIPFPWYVAATFLGKDNFIGRHVFYENLRRWTGGEGITHKPVWFYIPQLFDYCAPWSIAFIGLLVLLAKKEGRALWTNRSSPLSQGIRASVSWFLFPFLFLSCASGKHSAYLAPLLPGLCIAAALWLTQLVRWKSTTPKVDTVLLRVAVFVAAIGPVLAILSPVLGLLPGNFGLSARSLFDALAPRWMTVLFFYLVLTAALFYLIKTRTKRGDLLQQWGPPVFIIVFLVNNFYLPIGRAVRGITHGDRVFAMKLAASIPAETPINWIIRLGPDPKLGVGRDDSFDTIFFYLHRRVKLLSIKEVWNEPGLYAARREWVNAQSPEWRARVSERFEGGKLDDRPGEKVVIFDLAPGVSPERVPAEAITANSIPSESDPAYSITGDLISRKSIPSDSDRADSVPAVPAPEDSVPGPDAPESQDLSQNP